MPRIGRGHFLGGPNLYAKVFQVSRVELLVNPKDALIQIFFNPELVGDIAATSNLQEKSPACRCFQWRLCSARR